MKISTDLTEDLRLNHKYCPKNVIVAAADEIERLRGVLIHIVCDPINAGYMAQNALEVPCLTAVLGGTITFMDDGKGKHMSHEAHISKCSGANGVMGYATLEAVGYGATPDEALNDLRLVVADLVRPNA